MLTQLRTAAKFLAIGLCALSLAGCMTAALVGLNAVGAAMASARGPVQTKFANEQAAPTLASELGSTRSVAIWTAPDVGGAAFAQAYEASGSFERVVGPALVAEALRAKGFPADAGTLTQSERARAAATVAEGLGVDGVLTFAVHDENAREASIMLGHGSRNLRGKSYWFDRSAGAELWEADVNVNIQLVSSKLGPQEIMSSAAQAVMTRLTSLASANAT